MGRCRESNRDVLWWMAVIVAVLVVSLAFVCFLFAFSVT